MRRSSKRDAATRTVLAAPGRTRSPRLVHTAHSILTAGAKRIAQIRCDHRSLTLEIQLIGDTKPDLPGLSVAMTYSVPTLVTAVDAVRGTAGETFPILVGGHVLAWAPELESRLGVVAFGTCADTIVTRCRKELGW